MRRAPRADSRDTSGTLIRQLSAANAVRPGRDGIMKATNDVIGIVTRTPTGGSNRMVVSIANAPAGSRYTSGPVSSANMTTACSDSTNSTARTDRSTSRRGVSHTDRR